MNNLQFVINDSTRYAMHVAVELCEQGDFDSVTDAFRWLMQERDDSERESGTCENVWAEFGKFKCSECAMEVNAISTNTTTPRPIAFCPNCGRLVGR